MVQTCDEPPRPQSEAVAELLAVAEEKRQPLHHHHRLLSALSFESARAVALARDDARVANGDVCVGYKLGWTSAAMRKALGMDRPNWGTLWRSMQVSASDAATPELQLASLIHPKAEPELACLTRTDLGAGADVTSAVDAIAAWTVALEIVDPRFETYRFTFEENTADNSSAARFVLGEWSRAAVEPADVSVELIVNGESVGRGAGSGALGSPVSAVAWLARALAGEGGILRAGSIILTGGLTAPIDLGAGQLVEVRSADLGSCRLRVRDEPLVRDP